MSLLKLYLDFDRQRPLYLQLYEALRMRILRGELRPGERLPATRSLADDLGVSRNVVVAAYEQLQAEGYVSAHVGSGTYVERRLPEERLSSDDLAALPQDHPSSTPQPVSPRLTPAAQRAVGLDPVGGEERIQERMSGEIQFALGGTLPDPTALSTWSALLQRELESWPLDYGEPSGAQRFRGALARYLHRTRGIEAAPEQILVVTGAQQALDLIGRALVTGGSRVILEDPVYYNARWVFELHGAEIVHCPLDDEGLDLGYLPTAPTDGEELVYVTPSHQFPSGVVTTLERRRQLLRWAEERAVVVVEDDYEVEFRHEGKALPAIYALDHGRRVIYLGTFSRILFPDLRLGYMVLPPTLVQPFLALKRLTDWHTPALTQAALAHFLEGGHYERHLRRVQRRHAERRRALLTALDEHLGGDVEVRGTASGLHVVVWFPQSEPADEDELLAHARDVGVGVQPISSFSASPPPAVGLVLGYGRLDESEIREGVRRLARAWRRVRPRRMARDAALVSG